MPLRGRVAWVTGAGRGIGRACALDLAGAGFDLVLTSRSKPELEAVAKEVRRRKQKASVAACDVTDAKQTRDAYEAAVKELGPPLILVAAAGIARGEPFLRTTDAFFEEHWRLNVMGVVHSIRCALPAMLEAAWGRIVVIASVAGLAGGAYISAYAASKHAVVGVVRSVAAEVDGKGVTVNAVCPGYVDTPMTAANVASMAQRTGRSPSEMRKRIEAMNPSGRLIPPEAVASAVRALVEAGPSKNGLAVPLDAEVPA